MKKSVTLLFAGAIVLAGTSLYAQQKGDAAKGKDVFDSNCGVCHNSDSDEAKIGPGLKGISKKAKMSTADKKPTDANILQKVNEGGNGMPPYKVTLSDAEKTNLIAYLKSL
jgi:mono/diheme cytochrome c family protein